MPGDPPPTGEEKGAARTAQPREAGSQCWEMGPRGCSRKVTLMEHLAHPDVLKGEGATG